jgi:phospholipase C
MPKDIRARVGTIAILMLENRSFDHMFSCLTLDSRPQRRNDIDAIRSLNLKDYINRSVTKSYRPWITNDDALVADLPHGRDMVDVQLRGPDPTPASRVTMRGFVEAYRIEGNVSAVPTKAAPMAVQAAPWMMEYFATNHLVCDRWFAPLPADTQPNRLVALSGFTTIDNTKGRIIEHGPLVFDWLEERGIPWRVYRSGLPFEMLIKDAWKYIFDNNKFRSVKDLAIDVTEESEATFPKVIFIEPAFSDSPIKLGYQPNDDHPPVPIGPGQQFMREAYMALSANPARWAKTVMIVTYDEHGGFYDHVSPHPLVTRPPANGAWTGGPFTSTGVRIPGVVASPLVSASTVSSAVLDHTSILQLLASMFGDGKPYSDQVESRRTQGIGNITDLLDRHEPRTQIPHPPPAAPLAPVGTKMATAAIVPQGLTVKKGENAKAFEEAARRLVKEQPEAVKAQYKEMLHWAKTNP